MIRIVVVDDESAQTDLMCDILKEYFPDEEVIGISEASLAIDDISKNGADVLLLDIRMPGMTGFELLSRLHLQNSTLVIMITAYDDFEYAVTALRAGVHEFLLKPLSKKSITLLINHIERYIKEHFDGEMVISEADTIRNEEIIERCCSYLREHFAEDITLNTLSDFVHISPAYLSNFFKTSQGIGYKKYLTNIRIEKACALLNNTNKKVYEIATLVGYDNYSSFVKIFKRETGVSPQDYRLTGARKKV